MFCSREIYATDSINSPRNVFVQDQNGYYLTFLQNNIVAITSFPRYENAMCNVNVEVTDTHTLVFLPKQRIRNYKQYYVVSIILQLIYHNQIYNNTAKN